MYSFQRIKIINLLYNKRINKINDVKIKEIINEIDIFNEFEFNDKKYIKLYKIFLSLIRKENLLLIKEIRAIIFNISFITNIIKVGLFNYTTKIYLINN